jgi:hypothetical protein
VSQTISPIDLRAGSCGPGNARRASTVYWPSSADSLRCSGVAIAIRRQKTPTPVRRRASGALQKIAAVCLTVAGVALIASAWPKPALQTTRSSELEQLGATPVAVASLERTNQGTLPIEDVSLGDRVEGRNPVREQAEGSEPDGRTWRAVSMLMRKDDGRWMLIELLRPVEWAEENDAHEGRSITLALPEMGAFGAAIVTQVGPCPTIMGGVGAVVTGKFVHESDGSNVIALRLSGAEESVRVTRSHLWWSVDRTEFITAGELRAGELVDTQSGVHRVESVEPCDYRGLLYNLETTEHVYCVGSLGALVHNSCIDAHHPILKAWGGNITRQTLVPIARAVHVQYHTLLRQMAKAANLPALAGRNGSAEIWKTFFQKNQFAQTRAMRIAYQAAKQIDQMHNTPIAQQIIQNIKNKQYTMLRPPPLNLP